MSPKTILYLRTDLGAQHLKAGGSVAHTLGVINGFMQLNHSVVCASSAMLDILSGVAFTEFLVLKNPSLLKCLRFKINGLLSTFFFTAQVLPLFKKHRFNFIYQRYSALNCTGVLLKKFKKIPFILEFNGSEVWVEQHWSPNKFFKLLWLYRWCENYNVRNADHIIVVSKPLKDLLIHQGIAAEKILINPNGVDAQEYYSARLTKERFEIREQLSIQSKFVFGFIGTFNRWHGIELLAKIIPAVIAQRPHAHFLLIGSGPLLDFLKHELRECGKEYVTITGHIPQAEAKHYLAACDAYLSPTQPNPDGSPFFGSPTKLFEYMSMGKPIIVSDLEQLAEIVDPALTFHTMHTHVSDHVGIRVAPMHPHEFIQAAYMLIDGEKSVGERMGNNARAQVLAGYTWLQHTQKILTFIL
jgi:glycosyltransferase involved in cell wall biosynthesis